MNKNKSKRSCRRVTLYNALLVLSVLLAAACATLTKDYPRTASTAFQDHESTAIGKQIAALAAQHPGESGFALIRRGRQAFTARVALADLAEKSLDVQYFLWERDATGRIFAERLLRAADRGVRIRILVDDVNLEDRDDDSLAALDAHPNVEIRIFNPFPHRFSQVLGFITDFNRVNHRMHNKLVVLDNALAIVGGRNMSDHYFEVDPVFNFRDLDIAAAGPVVRDLSKVFDRFWNGEWSVPAAALVHRPYTEEDLRLLEQRTREYLAKSGIRILWARTWPSSRQSFRPSSTASSGRRGGSCSTTRRRSTILTCASCNGRWATGSSNWKRRY
jgi:cardiolipin synthase C